MDERERQLQREIKELKEANEILQGALAFSLKGWRSEKSTIFAYIFTRMKMPTDKKAIRFVDMQSVRRQRKRLLQMEQNRNNRNAGSF
ncbi:hypothetical protein, partial [Treponema phagedenis]|uniref:hypothetical protein n=1 Tax=Treponema phagedenis TaxID=162 RepID=UPI001E63B301